MKTFVGRRGGYSAIVVALAASALTSCTLPDPVVLQSPTLEKCQKALESEAPKFEKKVFTALKKCKNLYRAAVADGDPLSVPAVKCDAALSKVLLFPDPNGKSAIARTKVKLEKLTDPTRLKCSDTDLVALNHLPTATFGDLWARLLLVQRIGAALGGQIAAIGDTPDILAALAANGCTFCSALSKTPCFETTCRLAATSTIEFAGSLGLLTPGGSMDLTVCSNSALLGQDLALFARPAKGLKPTDMSGTLGYICQTAIGGEGYITSSASALSSIAILTCQDHVDDDGDECPGLLGSSICASPTADSEHGGVTNSGACVALDNFLAFAGDAFLLGSLHLSHVCDGSLSCGGVDETGPDGIECTADDTPNQAVTIPILLTTLIAQTIILDAETVDGVTQTLMVAPTGLVFDPARVSGGDLSGGRLVGAFPGIHTVENSPSADLDATVAIQLICE